MKKNNFFNQSNNQISFSNLDMSNLFKNTYQTNSQNKDNIPKSLEEEIDKYSGMSEERLMQEMFYLVEEGRKNGTLDNQKLEEFFNSASCMLSSEQITKLRSLIDMAKNS